MLEYLREQGLEGIGRFYSTYRGNVIDNVDPDKLNRLLVSVPGVTSVDVWAFPKHQHGGLGSGFKYLTPSPGDIVFLEFESGDPQYPLWSYCGWAETEVPKELEEVGTLGIITPMGNKILLDDKTNSMKISIQVSEKEIHEIIITPEKISIETPKPIFINTQSTLNLKAEENTNINGKNIILNDGDIGTSMTDKVLERFNKIENDLNNLKQNLSNAAGVAIPQDGGKAAFMSLIGYTNTRMVLTTMEDIEHKTVKQ